MVWIPHGYVCGVGWQLQLWFDPYLAWELLYDAGVAVKKKKEKKFIVSIYLSISLSLSLSIYLSSIYHISLSMDPFIYPTYIVPYYPSAIVTDAWSPLV